jgi:hypothetical protein
MCIANHKINTSASTSTKLLNRRFLFASDTFSKATLILVAIDMLHQSVFLRQAALSIRLACTDCVTVVIMEADKLPGSSVAVSTVRHESSAADSGLLESDGFPEVTA